MSHPVGDDIASKNRYTYKQNAIAQSREEVLSEIALMKLYSFAKLLLVKRSLWSTKFDSFGIRNSL